MYAIVSACDERLSDELFFDSDAWNPTTDLSYVCRCPEVDKRPCRERRLTDTADMMSRGLFPEPSDQARGPELPKDCIHLRLCSNSQEEDPHVLGDPL